MIPITYGELVAPEAAVRLTGPLSASTPNQGRHITSARPDRCHCPAGKTGHPEVIP